MSTLLDPVKFPHLKFGVGQSPVRNEDRRLLTGGGRFTDDIDVAGQAYGYVLRSPHAHGTIRRIDTGRARSAALAVYTGEDLEAAGYGTLPCPVSLKNHDGTALFVPPWRSLALERVRFVGEPIAFVVAESLARAKDAAERIEVDIEPLPAVVDPDAAAEPDAPRLFDESGNVCLDWRHGDFEAVDEAFARAAHVTRLALVNNRVVVAAMEPRAAIAEYDAENERFTLHLGSQGVFELRQMLANELLKIEPSRLRVRTYDVGGSFGTKLAPYPEYVPLLHAARELRRPVKWCDERSGSFVSDHHGRDAQVSAELALDEDGNFLAVRVTGFANMGAYLTTWGPYVPTVSIHMTVPSLYRTPVIAISTKCVLTNTTPTGAYRGAGMPEANYYMERMVDAAARETGRDPVALRRQNLIPKDAIPYAAASGVEYDSGDFEAALDTCLENADWSEFEERRAAARTLGRLRGIGLACYLAVTSGPEKEMGGIRFGDDGGVDVVIGTQNYGQGHASTVAQILVDKLGLPFEAIHLKQGDSDELLAGVGSYGSRSTLAGSNAVLAAADEVIAKGRELAGHFLETAVADIEFDDGAFRVAGTDRRISLLDLAAKVRAIDDLADGLPDSLDTALVVDGPPSSFPNGCHIAEVEVDPETGTVELVRYTVVDDFGTLINPALVEGQIHGGIAQGIGQTLSEMTRYDADGQFLSGSFMDYAVPRADQIPDIAFASNPVPATTNPLGVKGCGEAGVTGAMSAVMNAVIDALAAHGVTHLDMPATPQSVWAALASNAGGR